MNFKYKKTEFLNLLYLLLLLVTISLSLTGCYFSTYYAFQKVSPEVTLQRYKSIYTTQDDIYFVIDVADPKTGKARIWCAKLPTEDVIANSIPVVVKRDTRREEYKSIYEMSAIPASHYRLMQHDCSSELGDNSKIFFNPNYGEDIVPIIKQNRWNYSLVVAAAYPHHVEGYVYIAQKNMGSESTYNIARAQHPIINSARSKTRIAMLPLFVALDVVTIPWQVFMWIHGPM